ncbi:LrgB family protein [Microvirga makkahensis]|uniref:LrgB family protein n=1 Tax=Microvirga makkahensis TaxID=1128670 RepID=A0A7X3MNE7_9HYPH|nr:LrgB family protein [Microvirga makkahensis]MXQ10291.1 LrgB family protein [Microvirga makkahensis]
MTDQAFSLWVYLSQTPLLWLVVTLGAYVVADRISQAFGRHPLCNPVLVSVIAVALVLWATNTSYAVYFEGAKFVHFLLGPATVALAIPLYQNRRIVLRAIVPMAAALIVGSVTAIVSAVALARMFDMPRSILVSLAPKSVTAPVGMGIAETLGGDPALTAILIMLTGVVGSVMVTPLMNALRMKDWRARGFAVGLASHGIGTARAFQVNSLAGTFAGIAMGLNALVTALLLPLVLQWMVE